MKKILFPILTFIALTACTSTPTETSATPTVTSFQIALVALEDAGQNGEAIGCGDSIVLVPQEKPVSANTEEEKVSLALETLLSTPAHYGESGLDSTISASHLNVDKVNHTANGSLEVELVGEISSGGVCDDPRISSQLLKAVEANSSTDKIRVLVNGELFVAN